MWTILKTARYLYQARRTDGTDLTLLEDVIEELRQLRNEAQEVGDSKIYGAADALERAGVDIATQELKELSQSENPGGI